MRTPIAALATMLLAATSASAHHSFAAVYDEQKPVTLQGRITQVEWQNPHVWIHIVVPDAATGESHEWRVECRPPNTLRRSGVQQELIPLGVDVQLTAWQAKSENFRASGNTLTLPDQTQFKLGDSKYDFRPRPQAELHPFVNATEPALRRTVAQR